MKPLFLLLATFFCLNIYGQIDFQDHLVIDKNNSVLGLESSYLADIDGDGDLDVLSASQQDDKIAWYENQDGQGHFSPQKNISINMDGAVSVLATDVDGDGDMDVVASSLYGGHKIAWFENVDGLGTFGTQQIIGFGGGGLVVIDAADLDNDGDIDILSSYNGGIIWYENMDGQGSFSEDQFVYQTQGGAINDVVLKGIFDINGDGFMDVLALGADSATGERLAFWLTNLEGTASFTPHIITVIGYTFFTAIFPFDVDGDNDLDLVMGDNNNQTLSWWENTDGQGNFDSPQTIATEIDFNLALFAADVDGDDDLDLLGASDKYNKLVWYENVDGLGLFSEEKIITNLVEGRVGVLAGDIDGDTDIDVLSISRLDNTVAWYENMDSEGLFGHQQTIVSSALRATSVFPADLDGDGDIDIISTSESDNKIAWYENLDGIGNYGIQQNISVTAFNVENVYVIDIDNDGDNDIVSASSINNIGYKVFWHENLDGLGHFGEEQIFSTELASDLHAIDMDGDEDIDIVITGHRTYWYENIDGQGDFSTEHVVAGFYGTALHVLDMDEDGDMDVLTARGTEIGWYENVNDLGDFGVGVFKEIGELEYNAYCIYVADLDNDDDVDIITGSSRVSWFENLDGQEEFGSGQSIYTADFFTSVHAADMDNDGDMDILSSNSYDDKIIWNENLGGFFAEQEHLISDADINDLECVYTADIDGDGDMDILSASQFKIAWHENKGILGNQIRGELSLDLNENACSENNLPMPNILVSTSNGTDEWSTLTQANGSFRFKTNEGDFETSIVNLPAYYSATPNIGISSFVGEGHIDTIDFCITPTEVVNDVNVSIIPPRDAVIGLFAKYQIVYQNTGTSQMNGNITLEYDPSILAFISADSTVVSQADNSLTFDYTNLNPFETRIIEVTFSLGIPPAVTVNSLLVFTATINPVSGDNTEYDNVYTFTQQAVGSYDPNDITVLEGERILLEDADKHLHYVIRFQNTGTYNALNIRVHNTLDDKLDWSSLQLESSSHSNRVEIRDGNEVDFIFDAIYLPDSTANEAESHGFIAYKIKPKTNVVLGDIFYNEADIFFDFNPAVETNTVATEIAEPVGFDEINQVDFTVYPVPTTGVLRIKSTTTIAQIEIYNHLGQLILANTNENKIDLSDINEGLYFCVITDKNGATGTRKVVRN